MATNCCTNSLNQVFCNAFNKYYNTLYANGEISKEETNNLLIIDYIRQCLSDDRYNSYYNILLKALRCIASNSCLLDISWLYNRSIVPRVTNKFVTILTKQPFVEKDPTVPQYVKDITEEEIYNWNHPSALGSLIVTVDPYSLLDNPSYDEIYTAWSSGLDVVAKLGDDSGIFQLSYIDSGTIMFIRSDNWNGIYVQYLLLEVEGNTETWTLSPANYLQSKLTFDNVPTPNSNNPVKSSGIYNTFANYCPIIEDTRSSAVAAITGVAPFASLVDGQRILLHLKYNTAASTTLNLTLSDGTTTTGAKDVYKQDYNGLAQFGATQARADTYLELVYDNANTRWMMVGFKDNNTTYSLMTQSIIDTGTATGGYTISPKLLCDNFFKKRTVVTTGSALTADTYLELGTTDTVAPTLPATYTDADEFIFSFTCDTAACSVTLPTGVVLADNCDNFSEVAAGVFFQVSIMNDVAAYLCVTPTTP